jgi:hypothetical protein
MVGCYFLTRARWFRPFPCPGASRKRRRECRTSLTPGTAELCRSGSVMRCSSQRIGSSPIAVNARCSSSRIVASFLDPITRVPPTNPKVLGAAELTHRAPRHGEAIPRWPWPPRHRDPPQQHNFVFLLGRAEVAAFKCISVAGADCRPAPSRQGSFDRERIVKRARNSRGVSLAARKECVSDAAVSYRQLPDRLSEATRAPRRTVRARHRPRTTGHRRRASKSGPDSRADCQCRRIRGSSLA